MEVASDRGEGGNGTLEGLQPETAREYTSGTRGRPFSVYCQFRRKFYLTNKFEGIFYNNFPNFLNALSIKYNELLYITMSNKTI